MLPCVTWIVLLTMVNCINYVITYLKYLLQHGASIVTLTETIMLLELLVLNEKNKFTNQNTIMVDS